MQVVMKKKEEEPRNVTLELRDLLTMLLITQRELVAALNAKDLRRVKLLQAKHAQMRDKLSPLLTEMQVAMIEGE